MKHPLHARRTRCMHCETAPLHTAHQTATSDMSEPGRGMGGTRLSPRQGAGPTVKQTLPSSPPSCRSAGTVPLERGSALTN
jgi:hypothetical protein